MKAAVISDQAIVYGDFPAPTGDGDAVVVRMHAAALTNLDIITAEGRHYFSPKTLPAVAGNEGVGSLPSGERRYFPVTSLVAPYGSLAECSLAKPSKSLPIPEEMPDSAAAAIGNAGLAAWLPLSWRAGLQAGETVTILGATGVTGLIAVAAARLLGAGRIVAAGRNVAALEKAKVLGADAVVHLDQENDLAGRLQAASDGGADVVIDYLNGPATAAALLSMRIGGRLVQIGSALGSTIELPAQLARKQSLTVMGFAYYHAPIEAQADAYVALCEAVTRGEITTAFDTLPLSDVADAWARQKAGSGIRLVLVPGALSSGRSIS